VLKSKIVLSKIVLYQFDLKKSPPTSKGKHPTISLSSLKNKKTISISSEAG